MDTNSQARWTGPLVLGGAATEAERRETPEVYERNINVKVIRRGTQHVQVLASFLDLEHSFDAEMIVDVPTGRIEHAKAHMAKRPFQNLCLRALENIPKLEGEVIGRGIYRRITDVIGKSQGCVHLAEIFQAAVGFTATILIGLRSGLEEDPRLSEEENRRRLLPVLQNSCQVFRVEDLVKK
ncbi:MAG TPA: DUF2889 domain-containing protein [Candidatus Acidoferrales bacterium]|nr:DUF2889 domain-containing protein [Candidatus Acidoferrales bacterium]